MKKILFVAISGCWLLTGCGPSVTFTGPQPPGARHIRVFPTALRGKYRSINDSALLIISDSAIDKVYKFDAPTLRNDVLRDSVYILRNDSLVNLRSGEKDKVTVHGDTLLVHVYWGSEFFKISDKNVLTHANGCYFLNSLHGGGQWEVKKLVAEKNGVVIAGIDNAADVENLKKITGHETDTFPMNITVTRRQFKKFVEEGFGEKEVFIRINEE